MKAQRDLSVDPPIARAHELVTKFVGGELATLWLNPPGELLGAPPAQTRFWQPHFSANRSLRQRGWEELELDSPLLWSRIVLYASKHKEETARLIAAARSRLKPDGVAFFAAPNDYGGKSYERPLKDSGALVSYENGRKSRLYRLAPSPASLPLPPLERPERRGDGYWTSPGLFSWSGVDAGSALLAEVLQEHPLAGKVADLGAGWGYLSSKIEGKTELHLFESDRRGLDCARGNLKGRNASFHWCDLSDLSSWPEQAPTRFDHVITNPPFHTGQREETGLGQLFARLAHRLLERGGTLWLVGNAHLGYPRLLGTLYREIEVKAQARGFCVVKARA